MAGRKERAGALISAKAGDMIEAAAYLAAHEGEVCQAGRIAEDMGVGRKPMCEALGCLVQAGVVESVRGRRGGYRLKVAAEKLTLGDIVEIADADVGMNADRGKFRRWRRTRDGMRRALGKISVAEIL